MPTLVLNRVTGLVATEFLRIDEYAAIHGLQTVPTVLDGDVCVKLLLDGEWIATAQYV